MHKRFLKHLNGAVVTALNAEVNQLTQRPTRELGAEEGRQQVLRWLRTRWRFDDDDAPDRRVLSLPAALIMHQYGWAVPELVDPACQAMAALCESPQPRAFEKLRDALRPLLEAPPATLTRRPRALKHSTQLRAGDLLCARLGAHYLAAYVQRIASDGTGQSCPVIVWFDRVFEAPFGAEELRGAVAKGRRFRDGQMRPEHQLLWGLNHQPDPAAQLTLVSAQHPAPPDESHLGDAIGGGTVYTFTELLRLVNELWPELRF